jgi:phosphoglycerol transferase MdoB-like AlkP superfamily enzyme
MNYFGNPYHITPNLDSIAKQGIFFTACYATGTRTLKGLEVLSMAIPPLPGQSIVRRPNNEDLFTLGAVLRKKGYSTQFMYGGYSSFDNMGYYFRKNGYEVFDRSALNAADIHYANIWGVADEDMFTYSLKKMDENFKKQQPFFTQIMTVSNHRPYTYPENRIDISPKKQIRDGAVKYTDYAIGRFIREAAAKPWFDNTIFIIIADHCAYAAGKTALPVTGYHIPYIIYSPKHIQPRVITRLSSQIDVPPTILGLLNMSYRSKFFGQDFFRIPEGLERAFISTYQGLGYIRDGQLIVQQPPKRAEQLQPDFKTGMSVPVAITDSLYYQAASYYQMAEKIYRSDGYKENKKAK